jgi:hypothetical protein
MNLNKKIILTLALISFTLISPTYAQQKKQTVKNVNFGYSANPPAKTKKKSELKNTENNLTKKETENQDNTGSQSSIKQNNQTAEIAQKTNSDLTKAEKNQNLSVSYKTREVASKAVRASLPPTEIYKVGVGDVLFINLQDQSAKYYTVLIDGTIDYPLAGNLVSVVDLTTDEIESLLRDRISLYENPQVTVKIREYVSHQILVEGLAREGQHFLQREAMPLVVVKTMVGIKAEANEVIVERENNDPLVIDLESQNADDFLIKKGDKLVFRMKGKTEPKTSENLFYFAGEKICSGGKKDFHQGITLVQAIFDICGTFNDKLKIVTIMRKTESGHFITKKYNVKDILNGEEKDPKLNPGDMIDSYK